MEDSVCLVCSYVIVGQGYALECGHVMHNECFDPFLQLSKFSCDTCAGSQWYFSSGLYEADCLAEEERKQADEFSKHETDIAEHSLKNNDPELTNTETDPHLYNTVSQI